MLTGVHPRTAVAVARLMGTPMRPKRSWTSACAMVVTPLQHTGEPEVLHWDTGLGKERQIRIKTQRGWDYLLGAATARTTRVERAIKTLENIVGRFLLSVSSTGRRELKRMDLEG